MTNNLISKIEAILFLKAEPVRIQFLEKHTGAGNAEIKDALLRLEERLRDRGVRILFKEDSVMLGTAPELSALLSDIAKAELTEELSRAALETLTVILYRGPIHKSSIDFIRGVNSQFILRNLLVRGLIERVPDEKDKRILQYRPTFELLQHLGITRVSELPEYEKVHEEIQTFKETFNEQGE